MSSWAAALANVIVPPHQHERGTYAILAAERWMRRFRLVLTLRARSRARSVVARVASRHA